MDLDDAHDPQEQLGAALRSARRHWRLSQRELARLLHVDPSVVGRWESGAGPSALSRTDAVLRMLGFRLVIVDCEHGREAPGADDPSSHVRDRGLRRYPAHLPVFVAERMLMNDWLRARGRPNPYGEQWTFERRAEDRQTFPERLSREVAEPPGQWEPGGPFWWEAAVVDEGGQDHPRGAGG